MNLFSGSPPNRTSRLYKALVETELAASVSGSFPPTLDPYLYRISATTRSGKTPAQIEEAIDAEIARVLAEPISSGELETALKQTKAQFAYSSESVTNQGFWLGYSSVVADVEWFETFLEKLEAVTVEEVHRVANAYLLSANRTVGTYLGEAKAEAAERSGQEVDA
jgi:zinc protease